MNTYLIIALIIYFWINTFIAGFSFGENDEQSKTQTLIYFLFGTVLLILSFFKKPRLIIQIEFWYQLNFTNYYKNLTQDKIYAANQIDKKKSLFLWKQWQRIKAKYNY